MNWKIGSAWPSGVMSRFHAVFALKLRGDVGLEEAGLGRRRAAAAPMRIRVVRAVEKVLGEAFARDVDEPAAGLADEVVEHLREIAPATARDQDRKGRRSRNR